MSNLSFNSINSLSNTGRLVWLFNGYVVFHFSWDKLECLIGVAIAVILIPTQEPLSAFLMTTFLSSARDLFAFHSRWDKLDYLAGLSTALIFLTTKEPLSAFLKTIFLSSTTDIIFFNSS